MVDGGVFGELAGDGFGIVGEAAGGDGGAVDDGDDAVHGDAAADAGPVEGFEEGFGQREAGGFDEDVLGRVGAVEQRFHDGQEVVRHRAAEAAIGEFDDVVFGAAGDAAGSEGVAVDADFAEFVDDDGDAAAAGIFQHVADQGGFAGAEEAGDDGGGDFGVGGGAHWVSFWVKRWPGTRATMASRSEAGAAGAPDGAVFGGGVGGGVGEQVGGVGGGQVAEEVGPFAGLGDGGAAALGAVAEADDGAQFDGGCVGLGEEGGDAVEELLAEDGFAFHQRLVGAAGGADVQARTIGHRTPFAAGAARGTWGADRPWAWAHGSMSENTAATGAPRPASRSRDEASLAVMAGLLARGSDASGRPSRICAPRGAHPVAFGRGSPLTVAGAAAALGRAPHRIPFSPSWWKDHPGLRITGALACQSNGGP